MITLDDALANGEGIERPFNCISPDHADSHASASVNVAMGVWYCYACRAHGTLADHVPTIDAALSVLTGSTPPRHYAEPWLDMFDANGTSPYWSARYGTEVSEEFRCGTHPLSGLPTYPIEDRDRNVLGVVVRQEGTPKYLYPKGVGISRTLFGHKVPSQVVILVEGASDVMALHRAGAHEQVAVLGCYGSGLHAPQLDIIKDMGPRVIIAAFDADDAGRRATELAHSQCEQWATVIDLDWSVIGHKDPGDAIAAGELDKVVSHLAGTLASTTGSTGGATQRRNNRKREK